MWFLYQLYGDKLVMLKNERLKYTFWLCIAVLLFWQQISYLFIMLHRKHFTEMVWQLLNSPKTRESSRQGLDCLWWYQVFKLVAISIILILCNVGWYNRTQLLFVLSRQGPFPLNFFPPAVIGLETIIDLSEQTFVISLLLLNLLFFTKFCVETRSLCDKNCLKCCENH